MKMYLKNNKFLSEKDKIHIFSSTSGIIYGFGRAKRHSYFGTYIEAMYNPVTFSLCNVDNFTDSTIYFSVKKLQIFQ